MDQSSQILEEQRVTYKTQKKTSCSTEQHQRLLGMRDAMDIINGKWKLQLIGTLLYHGPMRFMDLQRNVHGIAAKMLSKELQDLEANRLVKRTVKDTKPITVEYEITPHGKSLENVIEGIANWGADHRSIIMKGDEQE